MLTEVYFRKIFIRQPAAGRRSAAMSERGPASGSVVSVSEAVVPGAPGCSGRPGRPNILMTAALISVFHNDLIGVDGKDD
jgi:hypothetical protein